VSTYDIQGRLLSQSNPYFGMTLRYDNPLLGTPPSYTGNISEWEWRQGAETPRTYAFRYDGASRLKEAWAYTNGTRDFRFEERGITYDGNGNILTLSRTDQYARAVDDLRYTYTGNRLTSLEEQAGDFGAEDLYAVGGGATGTYAYDGCGNLTVDSRRGLNFSYNSLNLLSRARKSNGEQATYSYSADGQKRRVVGADGRGFLYRGSMLYKQEGGSLTLESAAFAGGRFYADGNTTEPYYFLTDHLGNVRALLDAEGSVREQNDYYPFGAQHKNSLYTTLNQLNRFKFGGKEMQTIANLGSLDFGARQYDQLLARWFTIDPLAEKYYSWSPYAYCINNPIKYIDPDGREIWIYYEDDKGEEQKMLYTAGMKYNGKNEFLSKSILYLNAIHNNGGSKMLGGLISSSNSFNLKNQLPVDNKGNTIEAMQFNEFETGGGDIYAGVIMDSRFSEYSNIENISHELFHGIQHEKGQGGASIFNEVEANVYSRTITLNWAANTEYSGAMSANGLGTESPAGKIYQNAFKNLLGAFSDKDFIDAVRNFRLGSEKNASGLYNRYPFRKDNQKLSILKRYHPQ
jgi:RHS repeat-associated protein